MQKVISIKQANFFFNQTLEIIKESYHIFLTLHILHKSSWLVLIKSLFFNSLHYQNLLSAYYYFAHKLYQLINS